MLCNGNEVTLTEHFLWVIYCSEIHSDSFNICRDPVHYTNTTTIISSLSRRGNSGIPQSTGHDSDVLDWDPDDPTQAVGWV